MAKAKRQQQLFKIILTSLLIAMNVVLERWLPVYRTEVFDVNLSFITVAFAAAVLGTPYAVAVAGMGDVVGAILFPMGAYFPGFTLTNCIYGIILGEFLHKNATILKISLAVIINKITCTLVLNSLWVSIMYFSNGINDFPKAFYARLTQAIVMAVVEMIVLIVVFSQKSKVRQMLDKNLKRLI